jgi:curved DNA-binding protein
VVSVAATDRFELRDSDLHTMLDLAPWEAALGCTAKLSTLDGEVSVKVPAGSSSGREIRLAGKGYPRDGGGRGDLYAELRIRVPSELSDEERRLFTQLAETSRFRARPAT